MNDTRIRLTDKLNLLANARFSGVMERRLKAGKTTVNPCVALAVMFALVNRSDMDGVCHPSLELIAVESQANIRTVQRVIGVFEAEGLVRVERRHHQAGAAKPRSTNVYTIDWKTLDECRDGGSRSRDSVSPDRAPTIGESHVTESSDHTTATTRSHDSHDTITRQPRRRSKVEPPREPPIEPPPAPTGGEQRGGGGEHTSSQPHRDSALAILESYPPTRNDVYDRDVEAIAQAIEREQSMPERFTWQEIQAAAAAVRKAAPASPMYARNWAKHRGYFAAALQARAVAEATAMAQIQRGAMVGRDKADRAAADRERERVDGVLSSLTAEEIERFRVLAIDQATPFQRRLLEVADPAKSRLLRLAIVTLADQWRHETEQRGAA